ncbi:MAG TPA: hypothetical protein VE172_05530 [Stackebrandtia sp.]|jgi:hypothetical protein|uniref:hypothetical protein n=1 Tax=Stackebrandtia sp. TaxID=2023065 RepID=UPI002D251FE9|nr:hypothetical protein [Stackebrandtia sp.]HZE38255.1 hypothetical protein [Stackebrandtia sp.]
MKITRFRAAIVASVLGVGVAATIAITAPSMASADDVGSMSKLTQAQAEKQFRDAGITWSSSGGCTDRNNAHCTSFEQINSDTVKGAITLKGASKCAINITGGTETGHASGTYSHWNGYKLDLQRTSCLTNYVTGHYTSIGGSKWKSPAGNIYYDENNHWDVTYYNCGGCKFERGNWVRE